MIRGMATIEDAERMAAELPEVTEGRRYGFRTWFVVGKAFAWERPFSKADIKRFGAASPPEGPILAVRVADLAERDAVLATSSDAFFTIAHFEGYPAVLLQMQRVTPQELRDTLIDGWFACAPAEVADAYLAELRGPEGQAGTRQISSA